MKLKHIAINIEKEEELVDFYQNVLGFHFIRKYELNAEFSQKIFGIDAITDVFVYSNFTIYLELFVFSEKIKSGFAHICTEMEDREVVVERCKKAGYPIIKIEREEKEDLIFIMDKAENKFELKNW